ALAVQFIRGQLGLARGRAGDALAAFRNAERLAGQLAAPHPLARPVRPWMLHAMARLGDIDQESSGSWEAGSSGRVGDSCRGGTQTNRAGAAYRGTRSPRWFLEGRWNAWSPSWSRAR